MERRVWATAKVQWPDIDVVISSPFQSMEDELAGYDDPAEMFNRMTGDLQRVMEYPKKGFQAPQDIPSNISQSYHNMVDAGFDQCLIKE